MKILSFIAVLLFASMAFAQTAPTELPTEKRETDKNTGGGMIYFDY